MPPLLERDLYFNSDEIYEACFISLIYCNGATFTLEMSRLWLYMKYLLSDTSEMIGSLKQRS